MIRPLSRLSLTLDIVGAVVGVLITVPISFAIASSPGMSVSTWVGDPGVATGVFLTVGVLMWGAVAVSRLSPPLALGIAWVGALLHMAAGIMPTLMDLPVFMVVFATAAWGSRLLMWLGAASTAFGGLLAGLYVAFVSTTQQALGTDVLWQTVTIGALLAVIAILALAMAWGAGLLWRVVLRSRRLHEEQRVSEALAAQEQERTRIARDMHDIVAHSLAVVIAQADGARYAAAADPNAATGALTTIAQTARGALSDVRMLLTQLRHRQGDGPQPTLADLEALFAQVRQAGIEPEVTVDPMPPGEPPGSIQLAVYRILQEALTNALRHGEGTVQVRLSWWPDRVDIEVRNAVRAEAVPGTGGHGLIGMRERAQLVGGDLQVERDAESFVVRATLPIGNPGAAGVSSNGGAE